jgi:MFS family permease
VSQGIGRPIIGVSSDSVGRLNVAGLGTAFCGVLCVTLWVFSKSLATCVVFALLVGGVAGVMWAAAAPVLAEVIGLQMLPSGTLQMPAPFCSRPLLLYPTVCVVRWKRAD